MNILLVMLATLFIALYFLQVSASRPNIVLIVADDQDSELFGMSPMHHTQKIFSQQSVEFSNAFVTTPVCCPSRTSIFSGLYASNHKTVNNSLDGNCFGQHFRKAIESWTFPRLLKKLAGYATFFAGKYMNKYNNYKHVPMLSWDSWNALTGNSRYYNYTLSVNGLAEHHGDLPEDYLTNVITQKALDFLETTASPFFVMLCPPAPHSPFTPYPTYAQRFENAKAPRTSAYNRSGQEKHWLIERQSLYPFNGELSEYIDEVFRNRWRTLLSVDDMVFAIARKLEMIEKLQDTYIIYTSDNGYHMGQFGMVLDKRQPYEFDVRVPLLVRHPSRTIGHAKRINSMPILNIDLAPTILDLAQIPKKRWPKFDGQSFANLLRSDDATQREQNRDFLIEYWGEHDTGLSPECQADSGLAHCSQLVDQDSCFCQDATNNTYTCLRRLAGPDEDILYCEFADHEAFRELYDLRKDHYQLYNKCFERTPTDLNRYRKALKKLKLSVRR